MVKTHNLGYPRIGTSRQLKFAQESYWNGRSDVAGLMETGNELMSQNWQDQIHLDYVPVGDFSFYDHVLDTSFLLGNIPVRGRDLSGHWLDNYFRAARGRSAPDADAKAGYSAGVRAGEMTKWFNTNYHFIVPEFNRDSNFELDASFLLDAVRRAKSLQVSVKPVVVGPITYLALGKSTDGMRKLGLLRNLVPVYAELLRLLAAEQVDWVQVDEPILATRLAKPWQEAFEEVYAELCTQQVQLMLTTYFGRLHENLDLACKLPVHGMHLDFVNASAEVCYLLDNLSKTTELSLGVIDGRNVWKTDLVATLRALEPIAEEIGDRLWLAPSSSLIHVPVDLASEKQLDQETASWFSFARQKLEELRILQRGLNDGLESIAEELDANRQSLLSRKNSPRVHNTQVREAVKKVGAAQGERKSPFPERAALQTEYLQLPLLPTTTIGSFPQTKEIRRARRQYKAGSLDEVTYRRAMESEIADCVKRQEDLGIDVLVHGEAERNDMVEYFGEQLDGIAITEFGWVQSYGSRCVKPPIIYGDVRRPNPMTLHWISYAQTLTAKPVKGMLTGPVTILNWSFVRDDQPRSLTCKQLGLAIRAEVLDLEEAGVAIIQIDEAALREGLPLREEDWAAYLEWSIQAFRLAANGVRDETQIHTHMCYSEFNDVIEAIASMDADVITIENSRSNMELLGAFESFDYPNAIGPGVYDIHSPNIPSKAAMVDLLQKASELIPTERLWVNPDCGLKTRKWQEVTPALENMIAAAKELRVSAAMQSGVGR